MYFFCCFKLGYSGLRNRSLLNTVFDSENSTLSGVSEFIFDKKRTSQVAAHCPGRYVRLGTIYLFVIKSIILFFELAFGEKRSTGPLMQTTYASSLTSN